MAAGSPSPLVSRLDSLFDDDFAPIPDDEFDVTAFGAVGDGEARCTAAIQAALDAASDADGGVVVVPAGTYRTGALFLESGVELHLAPGATLRAITDDAAYPNRPTRVAGIEMVWPAAVLNVEGESNVRTSGEGTIDGNGMFWWDRFNEMRADYEDRGLRWAVDYDCERVRPVVIYDSSDVLVEGVTIERQGFWALTLTYSERVRVADVTVRGNLGGYGPSTDGINVDSSRDVLVEGCDVDGNDDCLCLKAGRDADGLRVDRPTENVIFRDCVTREGGGLVTVGSETSGGIRSVEAYDIRGVGTDTGVRFKSARIRGGVVEDLSFHDLSMDGVGTVFEWTLDWHPDYSYPEIPDDVPEEGIPDHWRTLTTRVEPPERGIPTFRDISVRNVSASDVRKEGWAVEGYADSPVRDVRFEHVRIDAPSAGRVAHAVDWRMDDVVVHPSDDAALDRIDCRNVSTPRVVAPDG